jgi:elongation factor 1-beta
MFDFPAPTVDTKSADAQNADIKATPTPAQTANSKDREVNYMGDVVAKIKVMPKSSETDLNEMKTNIEKAIPEGVKLSGFTEEPIAFGLKALMVTVVLADTEGGTESVESAIAEVNDVESVQVVEVGRAL